MLLVLSAAWGGGGMVGFALLRGSLITAVHDIGSHPKSADRFVGWIGNRCLIGSAISWLTSSHLYGFMRDHSYFLSIGAAGGMTPRRDAAGGGGRRHAR